jgi:hypothetical protein
VIVAKTEKERHFENMINLAIVQNVVPTPKWMAENLSTLWKWNNDGWYTAKRIEMLTNAGYTKVNNRWQPPKR